MKEGISGKKPFTKSRLVKELSWTCALPQNKIKEILAALCELSRREARNTFVIPGICKLEVVRRKPRKMRNPRTGETFMLPERDALRITAPRSLKLACASVIAPAPQAAEAPVAPVAEAPAATEAPAEQAAEEQVVAPAAAAEQVAAEQNAAEQNAVEQSAENAAPVEESVEAAPAEEAEQPAGAEAAEAPAEEEPAPKVDPNALISFRCPRCQQEVEATGDMVGLETECPTCGNPIIVPPVSEPNTIHANDGGADADGLVRHAQTVSSREAESIAPEKLKGLTIRIDVDNLGLDGKKDEPEPAAEPDSSQMISFVCEACKQEVEATRDLIGEKLLCPGCGAPIVVPAESVANTLHAATEESDPRVLQAMKGRTMRIDLGEDF